MMALGLVIAAIHGLFGSGTSFHFGASDLFKLVDPDAYRSLTWADLPRLLIKAVRHVAADVGLLRDRDQAAA